MSRTGLIAVGVIAGLAVAIAAAWLLFRDTTEPVTVDEAVTSFRTDTEPTPGGPSPIPDGVYVYATTGYEKTDALTGVRHRYPRRSTITITAAFCGASLVWRVLDGRSTEWIYCVVPQALMLARQDERHTFFGRTERTTYTCETTPIKPVALSVGMSWGVDCGTGDAEERGRVAVIERKAVLVAGAPVDTVHIRKTTRLAGGIRGTARHDIWFDSESGVPVRMVMVSRTTNDSPIGDVHYEEDVTLLLTSLTPRR